MRILVLQHLNCEHPGVFREFWDERGHERVTVELDEGDTIPSFDGFDLLAVMGGPMDVWQEEIHPWLAVEKEAIRHWVKDLRKPYLGICLGHQLLAEALGGRVTPMLKPEVGVTEINLTDAGVADPIFSGFNKKFETLQWHGAEVSIVPDQAVVLAFNEHCAVQAIRWGECAYGFQYHTEITPATVPDWGCIPEYKASLEAVLGLERASSLDGIVKPKLPEFRAAARRLDNNLLEVIGKG
ncbi:type 1 glutamine amidotransferase [Paraburkholderia sediminicola]|uniref:type 1 glutamine amidotransferase n=1 Tax=Paraburkholderia sediminicola TaxID=458836 RepID=UPI0038BB74F9